MITNHNSYWNPKYYQSACQNVPSLQNSTVGALQQQTCEQDIFRSNCLWFSVSLPLIRKWFMEIDKWSDKRQTTHFLQNLPAAITLHGKKEASVKAGKNGNLVDFWVASAALCTLQPSLLWIWWKVGHNPFQFGRGATVLLKTIDWLNRGTISQYAGADKPSRGETRCLRTERGTLASISLALKLTYNRGGETHTHTQKLGTRSTERARKWEVRENRKVEKNGTRHFLHFFFSKFSLRF